MLRLTLGLITAAALLRLRDATAFRELAQTSRDLNLELARR